ITSVSARITRIDPPCDRTKASARRVCPHHGRRVVSFIQFSPPSAKSPRWGRGRRKSLPYKYIRCVRHHQFGARGGDAGRSEPAGQGTGSVLLGQLGGRGGVVHPHAADPGVALDRGGCSAVGATHPNDAASLRAPPPDAYLSGRTTRRSAAVPVPGESARFL